MSGKKLASNVRAECPIGVFDSGLGGLTVVREIRRQLPAESVIYFGDLARLPYGTKSKEQIRTFSVQNALFLLKYKVKTIVIACNSSSGAAYQFLKNQFKVPVFDVIQPAVERSLEVTRSGRIGVIATQATIESQSYAKLLLRKNKKLKIFSSACPMFVPMVEEGWTDGKISEDIAGFYLNDLKKHRIDTLILGCTHYPLLKPLIQKVMGEKINLVDSAVPTVKNLDVFLRENHLAASSARKAQMDVYVSDKPRNFIRVGERFLGEKLNRVQVVRLKS